MTFGERIKMLREKKNLTQAEIGRRINLSVANISKYEKNLLEPNLTTLLNLAEIFEVTVDFMLTDTEVTIEIEQEPMLKELLDGYEKLNEQGKEKLVSYLDDLLVSGKYKKADKHKLGKRQA